MNMNVMFLNKFHHKRFLNLYNFLKDAAAYKKKKEILKMCYNITNSYNYLFLHKRHHKCQNILSTCSCGFFIHVNSLKSQIFTLIIFILTYWKTRVQEYGPSTYKLL